MLCGLSGSVAMLINFTVFPCLSQHTFVSLHLTIWSIASLTSWQKHGLTQAASYYEQARTVASTLTTLSPFVAGLGFSGLGKKDPAQAQAKAGPSNSREAIPSSTKGKETETLATKSSWLPALSAMTTPSTRTLYGVGAMALGAAAVGTAYYRREDFMDGWKWGYEHMTFVRNLWDDEAMRGRLVGIEQLSKDRKVRFWK